MRSSKATINGFFALSGSDEEAPLLTEEERRRLMKGSSLLSSDTMVIHQVSGATKDQPASAVTQALPVQNGQPRHHWLPASARTMVHRAVENNHPKTHEILIISSRRRSWMPEIRLALAVAILVAGFGLLFII